MVKKVIKLCDLSEEDKNLFRHKYDYFFFDLDGTLEELNTEAIPGVTEAIAAINAAGKEIYVYTDSCLFSRKDMAKRIHRRFPYVKEENIITASVMVVEYLKKLKFSEKVYLLGAEEGIGTDLKDAGFEVIIDLVTTKKTVEDLFNAKLEEGVGAVVVATDFNYNYLKLMKAVHFLMDPTTIFVTTYIHHSVQWFMLLPVSRALTIPLTAITGRTPITTGKSDTVSVEYLQSLGYDARRCLFVGDGIEADIKCGNKSGMDTLLVLSGGAKKHDLQRYIQKGDDDFIPTYVADSSADLGQLFS